jgi:cytochrome c biogenesis protein CcmG/thiol:disulfide interchange protein DsbE
MFKRFVLFVAVICMSGSVLAVEAGDVAPAFVGADEFGKEVRFPDVIDGKPTIMVFWATWCPYCKAFMPFLEQIQKDYGDDKINVVLINHKERGEGDPVAYTKSLDFSVISVMEGDPIGDAYTVDFIPGLMIAGADGRIAWKRKSTDLPAGRKIGEFWDMKVREQLDKML